MRCRLSNRQVLCGVSRDASELRTPVIRQKMLALPFNKKGSVNGMDCSHADAVKTMETAGGKSDFRRHRLSNLELMTYR